MSVETITAVPAPPTPARLRIRINGRDITLELRESPCGPQACTDGCGDQDCCGAAEDSCGCR